MPLADLLLPEFDAEIVTTRKVLERVPDDRIEWRPHRKSFPMGHLAQLVAMIPGWTSHVLTRPEFDIAPREGPSAVYRFLPVEQLLSMFDKNVAEARPLIETVSDAALEESWTLKAAGRVVNTMPRYMVYRTLMLNHLVHHRAQLGFYLRLTEQNVPQMYGPTADERDPAG
ncbi:MAG TPA: DinB family protein [Gemmatimonadaceae bacterium]|nr:DinB family protein [Gemmatimonadaceae bacterium]